MPILAAAITALSVSGTPIARGATYGGKAPAVPRTYSSTFTVLKAGGLPSAILGSYSGKSASSSDGKFASDTLTAVITEGPLSDIDIEASDLLSPSLSESRYVSQAKTTSDTLTPSLTDAVLSLSKSGIISKAGSDTLTLVVTESASKIVAISVTDTVTAVVTDAKSSLDKSDAKNVSDTLTASITETLLLDAVLAARNFPRSDTMYPMLDESASVSVAGDVDSIRVIGRQKGRITVRMA